MNKMKEIEDLWKSKKSVEKDLEIKKRELQLAIDEKDDNKISKCEKEIESLEKLKKQRDELINEKLKEYLEEKKNEKKQKSQFKKSTRKNIVKENVQNEEKDKIQIFFDISEGNYQYRYKDIINVINVFDENGKELISEQDKSDIETEISELVSNKEIVKKVDSYIFKILEEVNIRKRDEYIEAIESSEDVLNGVEIAYDFRTKENGRKKERKVKIPFLEKRRIKKMAKFHRKNKLAEIFKNKSRGLLYGLLAGLGISMLGAGGTYVNDLASKNDKQMEFETETNLDEEDIIIYNEDQIISKNTQSKRQVESDVELETGFETETEIETETESETETENKNKINDEQEDKKANNRIGGFVTVRLGAHIYSDPFDAVKKQLQKQTSEKVIVKTKNEDRVYKVTKEGLYCPDGTYIAIDNGDLKTAMQEKGLDVNILENIDSEEFESLGYKRMLHVVADGIAQWVEEGDTLQLEVDKFGNRVEKINAEKHKREVQQVEDYIVEDNTLTR